MIDTAPARVVVVAVLLVGQAGLLIGFGSVERHASMDRLTNADLVDGSDPTGRTVIVTGTIVEFNPIQLRLNGPGESVTLTVSELNTPVSVDDRVQIRGRMTGPRTIRADRAIVVPEWGLWYTWTISFLAGLWVFARIIRQWQVDPNTLSIVPRTWSEIDNRSDDGGK